MKPIRVDDFSFDEWDFSDDGEITMPKKDYKLLFRLAGSKAKTKSGKNRAVTKLLNVMIRNYLDAQKNTVE